MLKGGEKMSKISCCFCSKLIDKIHSNNASPISDAKCCNDCNWKITATNWKAVLIEPAGRISVWRVLNPSANNLSNGMDKQLCMPIAYESKSVYSSIFL